MQQKFFEPITGAIISFFSYEIFSDFAMSLLLAFLGGIFGYFGKWLCQRIIAFFSRKKNVFVSKTREEMNAYKSSEP